jgi:hypothetical protein
MTSLWKFYVIFVPERHFCRSVPEKKTPLTMANVTVDAFDHGECDEVFGAYMENATGLVHDIFT